MIDNEAAPREQRSWCILRMAGPRTLKVVEALNKGGIEAWTPTQMFVRRRPRSKVTIDQTSAIAPTFAFVRAEHLEAIRIALAQPLSPFPPFSLMQYAGRIPLIADREIAGFQKAEAVSADEWAKELKRRATDRERDARDAQRRKMKPGSKVSINADAFMGMTGVVIDSDRKEARVDMGGGFVMKIDTWLLVDDALGVPLAA